MVDVRKRDWKKLGRRGTTRREVDTCPFKSSPVKRFSLDVMLLFDYWQYHHAQDYGLMGFVGSRWTDFEQVKSVRCESLHARGSRRHKVEAEDDGYM